VETDRARARAARVDSSITGARAALTAARVSLAEAMGVDAASMNEIPTATETFANSAPTLPTVDALIARAMTMRRDVRARAQRQSASETLALGARLNLRRRYDFNVNAGLTNVYSSPIYRYLPDEQGTIIPAPSTSVDPAIRYYSPLGYYRTFSQRYEPFAVAQFQIELPFGNRTARGRLGQAEATLTSTRIDAVDLARSIHDNVVDLTGQIRQAAATVDRWQAAVRADEEALQGVLQRFEIREVKLIDTILTEETTTQDRLQLIAQRQQYLSLLARLRFETGELLTFDTEGQSISDYKFDPTFLVGR
jgi:outer membrane protein TolC